MIEDFDVRVKADPRMTGAAKEWSACMTERGQLFVTPWAMRQQFQDVSEELCMVGSDRHRQYNDALVRELAAAAANLECEPALLEVEDQVIAEERAGLLDALNSAEQG